MLKSAVSFPSGSPGASAIWRGRLLLHQLWCSGPKASQHHWRDLKLPKTGLTYLAAVAVGVMVFGCPVMHHIPVHEALGFLIVLPLLWASLRQGPRDTATVALIISAFAVGCTLLQCGPFAKPSLNDSFILLLAFMISTAVLSLALSTDVAVRQRIENQQRQRALETEVLWQATVQVAFGGSFEDLLRGCLERICRVTGWPAGHVYVPDNINDPHRLLPSPVWHFQREELAPLAHETAWRRDVPVRYGPLESRNGCQTFRTAPTNLGSQSCLNL